jgi:hypothetical protein
MLSIRVSEELVLQVHPERSTLEASVGCDRVPVADIGIMLVELLAFAADQLSRYQDQVAAEAHLDTPRSRRTLRRSVRRAREGLAALEESLS